MLTHDVWEEVLILEGSFHDLTLGRTFTPGWYACRPPGMRHGPYECPDGCLALRSVIIKNERGLP